MCTFRFCLKEEVEISLDKFFEVLKTSGGHVSPRDAGLDMDYDITYDFTFIDKNLTIREGFSTDRSGVQTSLRETSGRLQADHCQLHPKGRANRRSSIA